MSRRRDNLLKLLRKAGVSDREVDAAQRGNIVMISLDDLQEVIDLACSEYHRQPVIKRAVQGAKIKVTEFNYQAVLDALHNLQRTQD